jgi:enoyl-CoA hydratase/carnithine racemase
MSPEVSIERAGTVVIARMTAGENRLNPTTLGALEAALDEAERGEDVGALVLAGEGKYFCNGFDLDWLAAASPADAAEMVARAQRLLARVLTLPVATVAAVNGHAFAAGAMLALACDARVMREDRGYLCLPEVDIGLVFTPGMTALLKARLPTVTAHQAMVHGRRFTAPEALAGGVLDAAVPAERVLEAAVELARTLGGKPRAVLAAIKRGLYGDAVAALEQAPSLPVEAAGIPVGG